MCGIAGIVSVYPLEMDKITRMNQIMSHRGPDHDGNVMFLDGKVWLGHRRLSILDLTPAAHQPMSYGNERYWIVFNGEIYNFKEVRTVLEKKGYAFQSHSDTEVILAAYAEWGQECQYHLNGMWAFLLYDTREHTLFVSRDRFGIKPLYFWISPKGFIAFASEIKAFTALPGWRAVLNRQRGYDFLAWKLMDHTDETLFENVFQIRGGECASINAETVKIDLGEFKHSVRKWYAVTPHPFNGDTFQSSAIRFRSLLEHAVNTHLQADVPVGSCLSGGIDSSSIVCLIRNILNEQGACGLQQTFSACYPKAKCDERPFIDEIVRHTGVYARFIHPDPNELFPNLKHIVWHQDEPFATTSIYAQWNVFHLAASYGVKVLLDGQGADEVNAGYHGFFGPKLAGLMRQKRMADLYREFKALHYIHGYSPLWGMMRIADMRLPLKIRDFLRVKSGKPSLKPCWLDLEKLGVCPMDPFHAQGAITDTVSRLTVAQLNATNLPMLLHWEDRNSMAHSVEARVPFLDHPLVEFVLGLPDEFKIHQGITKLILRESMKGTLPESIRLRMDKLGFVTPEEQWMKNELLDVSRQTLVNAVESSQGLLRDTVITDYDNMLKANAEFDSMIWRCISFGVWIETFSVSI